MTREEAIDLLDNLIGMVEDNHKSNYDTDLRMAIKALSQEPICPSHGIDCEDCPAYAPCEQAISRQAVLHIPLNLRYDDIINSLPPVNPQPKTGHWIEEDMFDGDVAYRCSECNELFWIESGTPKDNGYNFCPRCGKKLVEPQESEEQE